MLKKILLVSLVCQASLASEIRCLVTETDRGGNKYEGEILERDTNRIDHADSYILETRKAVYDIIFPRAGDKFYPNIKIKGSDVEIDLLNGAMLYEKNNPKSSGQIYLKRNGITFTLKCFKK